MLFDFSEFADLEFSEEPLTESRVSQRTITQHEANRDAATKHKMNNINKTARIKAHRERIQKELKKHGDWGVI